MNQYKLQLCGRWAEIRNQVKRAYSNLTDLDLEYEEGEEEELLLKLQRKTGQKREELIQWINQLVRTVFD